MKQMIIRCPIHTNIYIEHELISNLINSKEFQRLKNIGQMSTITFLYPSATHTRFAHSLGVYEISRKILVDHLKWKNQEDVLLILCASLLHDIGHGPLSHTFEDLIEYHHEEMSRKLLLSNQSEVHQILEKYQKNFSHKVADIITKKSSHPLSSLVSGHLDSDRCDYLLRDSHFTSAKYGVFDLDWIIRSISFDENKNQIVYMEKGISAIENYLLARYFMYKQVYANPKVIAQNLLIKKIIMRAIEIKNKININNTMFDIFCKKINLDENIFVKLDDHSFFEMFKILENCDDEILTQLFKIYHRKQSFKIISLNSTNSNNESKNLIKDFFEEEKEIKIEIYDETKDKIVFLMNDDKIYPLNEISDLFKNIPYIIKEKYRFKYN